MEQNGETLMEGLGIVEKRGYAIYEQVLDGMCKSQNVSSLLRDLVCDLDLDTKELVFASYIVGKLNSFSEEEIAKIVLLRDLRNLAQDISNRAKDN